MPSATTLNNFRPQDFQNISSQPIFLIQNQKTHGDVGQDKDAVTRVRQALRQPVTDSDTSRTRRRNTTPPRSHHHPTQHKLVQVAAWVDEPIREQLRHIAQAEGLSLSQTIAALLADILRQRLHRQQAALLPEIIEQAIAKSHRALATRLSWLLVRIAFDTGQTRVLATNALGLADGMTEQTLKEILATADRRTKANLTRRTPQLTELMASVEQWLLDGEGKEARAA